MKRSRRAASRGVVRFFSFLPFSTFMAGKPLFWDLVGLANHPTRPHLGPPCHTITCPIVHPNTMQHALGAVLCVCKRWGVFGNVWGCLQPDMWFGDHLRVGPSQRGSDHKLAPRYPQTPPHANICFIWCIYMVYEVVGCVWCQRWAVHGR